MNKLFFIAIVFLGQFIIAQEDNKVITNLDTIQNKQTQTYNLTGVEFKPEYPGGINEFYSYIQRKIKIPNVKDLTGKIIVSFVIEKDGSIVDIKVFKDLGYGIGDEVIRVLKNSKRWKPAMQLGKPVRCSYMLPIAIK